MSKTLGEAHKRILLALEDEEQLSYDEIATKTGLSRDGIRGRVSELTLMGFDIEKERVKNKTYIKYDSNSEDNRKLPVTYGDLVSSRSRSMDDYLEMSTFVQKLKNYSVPKEPISFVEDSDTLPVLVLSDLHIGQQIIIDDEELFNVSIAEERINELTDKTIDILNERELDHIDVLLIGDMVDGDSIYKNHIFEVEVAAREQVTHAVSMLTRMFKTFNSNDITVNAYCVRGNHGIVNYKNVETDNWDNVVYDMLELVFDENEDTNVVHFKSDAGVVSWNNRNIVITHGENMSTQISTPSGVAAFRGMSTRFDLEQGDIVCVGHWHTFGVESDHDRILVRNGSLTNTNDYAMKKNLYSSPSQTLLIIENDEIYPTIVPINLESGE